MKVICDISVLADHYHTYGERVQYFQFFSAYVEVDEIGVRTSVVNFHNSIK